MSGVAAEARLLVVQAGGSTGAFSDVEEAAAIVYAVDHGARIINLSLGGPSTSSTERRAIDYAVSKGALLVAAVGNSFTTDNAVEYPAALLQPSARAASAVSASPSRRRTATARARRSRATGTHVSLAAPGEDVFSAVASEAPYVALSADLAPRLARRPLRLRQRHVVLSAAGRGSRRARLGREPLAARGRSRLRPGADSLGTGKPGRPSSATACSTSPQRLRGRSSCPSSPLRVDGRRNGTRVELSWTAPPGVAATRSPCSGTAARHACSRPRRRGRPRRSRSPLAAPTLHGHRGRSRRRGPRRLRPLEGVAAARAGADQPEGVTPAGCAARRARREARGHRARRRRAGADGRARDAMAGRRWSRAATAVTDASGRAVWRYALAAGSYRVRARYPRHR